MPDAPSSPSFLIRPAVESDAEALLDFYRSLGDDLHFFQPFALTLRAMRDHLEDVAEGDAISLVVVGRGTPIVGHGFIKHMWTVPARSLPGAAASGRSGLLRMRRRILRWRRRLAAVRRGTPLPRLGIGLYRDARGQGVAPQLMSALLEAARQHSAKRVALGVHKANVRAVSLYRRFGFEVVKEISQQAPLDSLEMELQLGGE